MENHEFQKEYNIVINTLSRLDINELLCLYVTAKTGNEKDIDKLPVSILNSLDELDNLLNQFFADNIIKNL